ncbi:hypothetical protein ACN42_g692 [Penicillium freii]|uniref:Uncharacterized protein n=1 Tax=Penicillium freii TaxID=48697 RepID=A0A117NS41_PENFR|nr:hypothetical protein ACN42_g692 [Penicillium freii]
MSKSACHHNCHYLLAWIKVVNDVDLLVLVVLAHYRNVHGCLDEYRLVTHRLPPQRDSCLKRLCHFFSPILLPQHLLTPNHTRSDLLQRY